MPKSVSEMIRFYVRNTGKVEDALLIRKRGVMRKSEKVILINEIMRLVNVPGMAKHLCKNLSKTAVKEDGSCDIRTIQFYMSRILKALVEAAKPAIDQGRPVSINEIRRGIEALANQLGVSANELMQFVKSK